jgi:molecular chaperone GrpE
MTESKNNPEPKDETTPPAESGTPPTAGAASGNGKDSSQAPEANAAPEAAQEALVGLTMAEYAELQHKIEQSEQKSKEYFDGWQRERADFNNFRRRIERENTQLQQNLTGQVLKKYLVVVDDLARALKARPTQGEGAAWSEGVELIFRKMNMILEAEGVKPIPSDDGMFDPNLHEAISHEDSPNHQSGQIIEVVQQGYLIGERVLRPALVRVAR